ncbi:hypothetical protein L7F22_053726 [Adiantum nelumboides]|nr:hypothetical protein [Adiantum nelumboides]
MNWISRYDVERIRKLTFLLFSEQNFGSGRLGSKRTFVSIEALIKEIRKLDEKNSEPDEINPLLISQNFQFYSLRNVWSVFSCDSIIGDSPLANASTACNPTIGLYPTTTNATLAADQFHRVRVLGEQLGDDSQINNRYSNSGGGLSAGVKAAIGLVCGLVGIVAIMIGAFYLLKRRRMKELGSKGAGKGLDDKDYNGKNEETFLTEGMTPREEEFSENQAEKTRQLNLIHGIFDDDIHDSASATVFIPKKPASPSRILSVQIYEDSVTFDCTPSYAFTKGTKSAAIFSTNFLDTPIYMAWALSQGYYVVAADHEGRHSQFIAGYAAGMRVLDGVRALTNFKKLSSPQLKTNVTCSLFSSLDQLEELMLLPGLLRWPRPTQKRSTSLEVSRLRKAATVTNLVSRLLRSTLYSFSGTAAYGGTPVDTKGSFDYINGGLFAGFAGAGVLGLMKAYPDLSDFVYSHLSDDGNKALEKAQGPNFCIGSVATGFPFTDFFKYINVTDPLSQPVAKKVLQSETLLKSASSNPDAIAVPTYPRLVLHSLLDEIIPYNDTKVYVQEQCDAGADIVRLRFYEFGLVDTETAHEGSKWIQWMDDLEWRSRLLFGRS